jgi:hypothetical protein
MKAATPASAKCAAVIRGRTARTARLDDAYTLGECPLMAAFARTAQRGITQLLPGKPSRKGSAPMASRLPWVRQVSARSLAASAKVHGIGRNLAKPDLSDEARDRISGETLPSILRDRPRSNHCWKEARSRHGTRATQAAQHGPRVGEPLLRAGPTNDFFLEM